MTLRLADHYFNERDLIGRYVWRHSNYMYAYMYLCESCHQHATINGFDSL